MSHDVFISHSSLDKLAADAICHGLEAKGIRCWIAPRDQTAGQPYGQQITQAIENADVMVLVFSDHVNQSQAVLNEINVAAGANVTIVPFRIASVEFNSELHFYLGRMHWLDAFPQPIDTYIDTLAETVHRNVKSHAGHAGNGGAAGVAAAVVEAPPAPPPAPPPPPPPAPPPPPPTPPPPPPAPPPQPVAPPPMAAGPPPYGAGPPGAQPPYGAPPPYGSTAPGAPPLYGAAAPRAKTDLRPLMIAGGVFGLVAFIVLIIAVAPHPGPTPAPNNTLPGPVVVANNTPAPTPNPTPTPPQSDQVPMGDGAETKPVNPVNTEQATQYETEVVDGGPPATLEGAAVINTTQLVQSMTDRDAGNAPFWLIDARGCSGEQSIPTAVCFPGYVGTNTSPNFQTMIAALQAKIPDKKAELVIFCHDGSCPYSYNLASAALTAGYENVFWYRGGINAWAASGLPTASDQQQQ